MAIAHSGELIAQLQTAMSTSSSLFGSGELAFAADQALNELGWNYPIDKKRQVFWAIQRGKRHAFDLLRTVSAHKFKYKQISLNHRFEHYDTLVKSMDNAFFEASKTDATLMGVDPYKMFGTYINNGIVYDQSGNDISRLLQDLGIDNGGYRTRYI